MRGCLRIGSAGTRRRVVALVCLAVGLGLGGCKKSIELPHEFFGTYTTTDASYADRYFTLSPVEVALGLGEGRRENYNVTAVFGEIEAGRQVYIVVYETPYGEDSLSFYSERGRSDQIVLKNQPDTTWTRGGPIR